MAVMSSRAIEESLTFRPPIRAPSSASRDYNCRACRGGPGIEEVSESDTIVLMRHGAFCKHFGRRHVTADVNVLRDHRLL